MNIKRLPPWAIATAIGVGLIVAYYVYKHQSSSSSDTGQGAAPSPFGGAGDSGGAGGGLGGSSNLSDSNPITSALSDISTPNPNPSSNAALPVAPGQTSNTLLIGGPGYANPYGANINYYGGVLGVSGEPAYPMISMPQSAPSPPPTPNVHGANPNYYGGVLAG